ncbi:adenine methyltransferase [Candidatus Pacearchaeota archaeon]|nr:adenine methyltransferase [Candidatus Pacearchaeota archaeon]
MNKNTQVVMFSSKTGEWSTPQDFFDKLNWRFGPFDLDPCAAPANTKCTNFFTANT